MTAPARITPTDILVAETVASIRERARAVEPYHPDRAAWVALRVAIELTPALHRPILRDMLAYQMATHTDPGELDELAASMRDHGEGWAKVAEEGAEYLQDPASRRVGA